MTRRSRTLFQLTIALTAGIAVVAAQQGVQLVAPPDYDSREGEASATAATTATYGPGGAVYNLRVASDASPDLTDLDSLIHTTTSQWPTAREKVLALFYWTHRLRRQTSPMVLHGHEVTDPIRNFQDYGFTMCSTVTGINQTLHEQLGLRHQYWDICGHTVANVEYDGRFHMVDNSFSNLVTTDDGVTLASVQEAAASSARLVKERSLQSTGPYGFLTGSDTLRPLADTTGPDGRQVKGYASSFCETGLNFRDYFYNWNAGHRYVLNLREHESYTRYYRPLQETPAADDPPEYWVGSERIDSPDPAVTFQIDRDNKFGNRGNGRWTFSPSLAAGEWDRAVHAAANITRGASGLHAASAAAPADLIYKVQGANAIASQSIAAQFTSTGLQSTATISLSLNHGLTWTDIGLLSHQAGSVPLVVNLRNEVNGFYETLIRVRMNIAVGDPADAIALTGLTITTITSLNVHALPKLNVGRNEIFVGLGDQSDTMVLWPDLRGNLWRNDAVDSSNVGSQSVSVGREYTAVVYPSVLTQEAHLTYRMEAPRDLTRVVYGGRLYNRQAGGYIDFLHSFDEGATWTRSYRLSTTAKPYDVIHYETVTNIPAGVRSVRFKFLMRNASTTVLGATGLYAVRMEANHQPQTLLTAPVEVTLRWAEVQANRSTIERSHKHIVDRFPARYIVNVGGSDHPVMSSMTLNVVGAGDGTPAGYSDGLDPGGTKFVPSVRSEGVNLAKNAPYTVSRAPSGFQNSAPATNTTVLTDGVVGAPVTGDISYWWGQCWASGTDVDFQVTLGASSQIGAFRAHVFGYPSRDALKGQFQDRVEVLTSADGISYASAGVLKTSLWKKDIPINHMLQDDGRATAWNFELILPAAATARSVIFRLTPRRDICISELQVLDRITYQPFAAIAPPPWLNLLPAVAMTSPQGGVVQPAPGSFSLAANASDADGTIVRVEFLANGNVIGQAASAPYTFFWQGVAAGDYSLTARAVDSTGDSAISPPVSVRVTRANSDPAEDIVLHAGVGAQIIGGWTVVNDTSAASGVRLQNPNAGAAKLVTPLAAPAQAFELSFHAEANRPYRLWLRGKALSNSYNNDSVFVQFDHSVNQAGTPMWRINTTDATTIVLEDCSGCGVAGWGWADNGYGLNVLGPVVYFDTPGLQRLRVQAREDGLGIDQVVVSALDFFTAAPGAPRNDATILPPTSAPLPQGPIDEVVLYAAPDAVVTGAWIVTPDSSAAGGARLQNPNAGAAKITTASPNPASAFELTFTADAGKPYRLWIRGKALNNSYNNDSVFVQFDKSVDQSGAPVWRLGTAAATSVVLEEDGGMGVQGWGWADNGYGADGPFVYFGEPGTQRLRIQVREDGLAIDQVVLSAVAYLTRSPGSPRNDTVIVPK